MKRPQKPVEKRHYTSKGDSRIVNFPRSLRKDFLSPATYPEVLDAPIHSTRIIFKILNDISYEQFSALNIKQRKQLNLFEQEFLTENNSYARFTFRVKDISETYDYTNIKRGLEFLENFRRGWQKSTNSKGKPVSSMGGFIKDSHMTDGYVTFLISAYWLEKLLIIDEYNVADARIAWSLSKSKQVFFYLWLLEVPEKGTKVNFTNLQQVWAYKYKDANTFAKNVLKGLKTKLDETSNKSFNYSVKGENIHIFPYYTKTIKTPGVSKKAKANQEVTQRLAYWKRRHGLEKSKVDVIKTYIKKDFSTFKLFNDAYSSFVSECQAKNVKTTTLQGGSFLSSFQLEIKKAYDLSVWKDILPGGYPVIIGD